MVETDKINCGEMKERIISTVARGTKMKLKTNAIITKYDNGILFIQFHMTRVLFSNFFDMSIHAISDKKQLFY